MASAGADSPQDLPGVGAPQGLSRAEAAARLAQYGPNAIAERHAPALWRLAAKFWAPVPWMLEAVIALQWLLGRHVEAAVIAALLVFNALVAYVQERRAQDALALLRQRLHVRARVLRDGAWAMLPAEALVPGDVVHVRAGDLVPADLRLSEGQVALDQSALTGESLPVEAAAGASAYAGAIVRQGEASGQVTATGARSYYGQTAELVRSASSPSHMQRTIFGIVKWLVVFDAALVLLVLAFAQAHHLPWADTAVFALMLLVASVPVALPATYTLATALSSLQLAHRGVLVTRLPAVEEAAAMDCLVSDKTGTLTQNLLRFSAAQPLAPGALPQDVLRAAALASDAATQDPLDLALIEAAEAQGLLAGAPARQHFQPFDPATRRSVGEYRVEGRPWLAMKGAASALLPLCRLSAPQTAAVEAAQRELAATGARVLAVAAGPADTPELLGLVALSDPPRPDAAALIAQLRQLGVRVRMATGDALETARAVAAQVGLGTRACEPRGQGLQNPEGCDLFARVLPADKHAIVKALQAQGHVTGMTGDGVNDAPALRQAELGVAVASATDVSKAAAGVVLTEPGLGGVIDVVRTGREVHRRMLTYTLNKILKVFETVIFLTAGVVWTGQFVISPTLIVLLLFANDFVTMAIAGDRVQASARPQRWHVGRLIGVSMVLAALSLAFSLGFYAWARATQGLSAGQLQTLVFLLLVLSNQANVYALRCDGALWTVPPAPWMLFISLADVAAVSAAAALGVLMAVLPASLIASVMLATIGYVLVLDRAKRLVFVKAKVP